ncbi:MAG TPA: efflux RND transporter periplasmic adaptor subunit [Pirellulaceae bacterium]|nr:efflux RND transporter periplasmic adaptor subunit [Pirellulaceae bacterium]
MSYRQIITVLSLLLPTCVHAVEVPPIVSVAQPIAQESSDYDFLARLSPPQMIEVRAPVDGFIESINCREGDLVKPGDLLLQLKSESLQRLWTQTLTEMTSQNDLINQSTEALRAAEGDPSKKLDLPSIKAAMNLNVTKLTVLKRQFKSIQQDIAALKVTATVGGVVGKVNVKPGEQVSGSPTSATLLCSIQVVDPVRADFRVDERTLLYLRKIASESEPAKKEDGVCPATLLIPGDRDFVHKGRVDASDNRIDATTGKIRFTAEFPLPAKELIAAAAQLDPDDRVVIVRLSIGKPQKVLLVPAMAISYDADSQPYVLVLDAKNLAVRKPVKLGAASASFQALTAGLEKDAWVIIGTEQVASDPRDKQLSPDDFTTNIRNLRIKAGTPVEPVRVELTLPQATTFGRARLPQPAPK